MTMTKKSHSEINVQELYDRLQNTKTSFNLRLTNSLKEKLDLLANVNNMSTNGYICSILEEKVATSK